MEAVALTDFFRGRLSIMEVINAPYGYIQTLKYIRINSLKDPQAKQNKEMEVLEDAVTGNL